jgi:replication factor C small subunit
MDTNTWLSKYNPNNLNEIIGQKNIVSILKGYINNKNIPHLLFAGLPGIGKTTSAVIIAKELFDENWQSNIIMMNASDERGIDVVRNKIKQATKFDPLNANFKIIFLDEFDEMCLIKGTKVITGFNTSRKICNIEDISQDRYTAICSLNIDNEKIESDKGICINTGISKVYEISLADGRSIQCTAKHPFFVLDENDNIIEKQLQDLVDGDEIIDFSDEIVNRCEVCGIYTTNKRFCSIECQNRGHSKDMMGKGNPIYDKDAWNKGKTKSDKL